MTSDSPFQSISAGLTVGSSYVLCVDLDGDGPLPLGPTGLEARTVAMNLFDSWRVGSFEVFATNVASAAPITINDAPGQLLSLTCDSATWYRTKPNRFSQGKRLDDRPLDSSFGCFEISA